LQRLASPFFPLSMQEPHLPPDNAPVEAPFYEQPPSFAPPIPPIAAEDDFTPGFGAAFEEAITLRSVARDILRMLRQPRPLLTHSSRPWTVWARVVGLYLIGMVFAGAVASLGAHASGATNLLDEMSKSAHTLQGRLKLLVLAGILAPLWEETSFRLPLAPFHPARVLPALALLGLLMLPAKPPEVQALLAVPLLVAALVCVLAVASKPWNERVARAWSRHFRWVLAFSILSFGFAHAGNYVFGDQKTPSLLIIPLLVMPQLIAGVLLAYARLRLGFWFGVLLHSSVNTALMLLVLSAPNKYEKPIPKPGSRPALRARPGSTTAPASRRDTALPARPPARPADHPSTSL